NEAKYDLNGNGVLSDNTRYKDKLLNGNPNNPSFAADPRFIPTPKTGETEPFTKRGAVKCYASEIKNEELLRYYEEKFNLEYEFFKSNPGIWKGSGLDFSRVIYTSAMKKEDDKYYNKIKTDDNFEQQIVIKRDKERQIGKFWVSPDYKIETPNPLLHPFDTEEVCIFAVDCGADCHDFIELEYKDFAQKRLSIDYNTMHKIRQTIGDHKCDSYYNCDAPNKDQFGKDFSCQQIYNSDPDGVGVLMKDPPSPMLCRGKCLPFCSQSLPQDIDGINREEYSKEGYAIDERVNPNHQDLTTASEETLCAEFNCGMYLSCDNAGPTICGCSNPENGGFNNACMGNNCVTRQCTRDGAYEQNYLGGKETICLSRSGRGAGDSPSCSNYGNCQSTSVCSCGNPDNTECVGVTNNNPKGTCYCTGYIDSHPKSCACGEAYYGHHHYDPGGCNSNEGQIAYDGECPECPPPFGVYPI
ncbi:MAG: hypothetical protein AABX34_03760, partial [Nanoarchaeota archaeon]